MPSLSLPTAPAAASASHGAASPFVTPGAAPHAPAAGDYPSSVAPPPQDPDIVGLILTGGGARAAYQVGVLKAVVQILQERPGGLVRNPFPVICGTSAGAINASALACGADDIAGTVNRMLEVWEHFHAEQVYRADALGVMRTGARWMSMLSFGWMLARLGRLKPRSLLDNRPLGDLLSRMLDFPALADNLRQGALQALAISASSYTTGQHITFYQSAYEIEPWRRTQRLAYRTRLTVDHLLASSAIPFVFPAHRVPVSGQAEWCGDGSMRQLAPISPAIHLGANKVLVIGAGRMHEPARSAPVPDAYPSVAQIAGHALSNIFLDSLAVDVERLERINQTLARLPANRRNESGLRPVKVLVIAPSQRLDDIASRHTASLPASIRGLLGGIGVSSRSGDPRGAALASYLLFEPGYTRELIALGFGDTLGRRSEVIDFFE
jgi:NTE family protein